MPVKGYIYSHFLIQKRLKKVVQKGNIFGPFFLRPAKQAVQTAAKQVAQTAAQQATQSPISESLMLTLGHVDAATHSNATGHAASLSVDHARMHDSSAPTQPLAPNTTLPPTTRAPRRRTHYGRPIGHAVIIETLSPPSLYPYVLVRPHLMELSIVLSGQPSFSFSDRSPVVSYNVMSRSRTETLALESTVLGAPYEVLFIHIGEARRVTTTILSGSSNRRDKSSYHAKGTVDSTYSVDTHFLRIVLEPVVNCAYHTMTLGTLSVRYPQLSPVLKDYFRNKPRLQNAPHCRRSLRAWMTRRPYSLQLHACLNVHGVSAPKGPPSKTGGWGVRSVAPVKIRCMSWLSEKTWKTSALVFIW
ncbi:hypothetical protein K439DRAFT_1538556 [Ramaria rubella]|nr:hypothetical protein K439DRAFT_1538556 [Ramaria rubella]